MADKCIVGVSLRKRGTVNQDAMKRSAALAVAMGVGIGTAMGVALHSLAEGVALGAAVSVAFGTALYRTHGNKPEAGGGPK